LIFIVKHLLVFVEMIEERKYIQNLRTSGTTPPVESEILTVHDGEIAIAMDNDSPRIFFKKNNGEWAEFVDKQVLLNTELAIEKALSDLYVRIKKLDRIVGNGISGGSISSYLAEKSDGEIIEIPKINGGN